MNGKQRNEGWPYIAKEVINVGTEETPDYQEVPKVVWIPAGNRGPYMQCKECRAIKEVNAKMNVHFAMPGSSRCLTHTLRFHKANGTLPDWKREAFMRQEEINERLRKGAYYVNDTQNV